MLSYRLSPWHLSAFRLLPIRRASTKAVAGNIVNIVEVGPRDGLQNEKGIVSVAVKAELINRLARAGLRSIEAGSFVSPKWVPQMAGTADVLTKMDKLPGVDYHVLVPNQRGMDNYLSYLTTTISSVSPPASTISIFTAATNAFNQHNTNSTIVESLARLAPIARVALDKGFKLRGYVSVIDTCPYSGSVDKKKVREVTKELVEMGCTEVSLGDTTGTAIPARTGEILEEVTKDVKVELLAGHFHDTFGTAVANVLTALDYGVRTIDASVGGLGGCPYSPGATGNVATEDVLYALQGSQYEVAGNIDLASIVDIGWWISETLGRESVSRAGRAIRARKLRAEKPKANL